MKYIKNINSNADYIIYYPKNLSISSHYEDIIYNSQTIISLNKVFHEDELDNVYSFFKNLDDKEFFGIIFSDLAIYQIAKEYNLTNKLIYDPNTLITNYEDFNFWSSFNILGVFVSPFITLEDLKLIGKNKKLKLFYQGYGNLNMFYSHRPLITNFLDFNKTEPNKFVNKILFLNEETRNEYYPIIETNNEIIIYTPYCFSCLDNLNEIEEIVDYLYIDESICYGDISDGFLNKKTIYRK